MTEKTKRRTPTPNQVAKAIAKPYDLLREAEATIARQELELAEMRKRCERVENDAKRAEAIAERNSERLGKLQTEVRDVQDGIAIRDQRIAELEGYIMAIQDRRPLETVGSEGPRLAAGRCSVITEPRYHPRNGMTDAAEVWRHVHHDGEKRNRGW